MRPGLHFIIKTGVIIILIGGFTFFGIYKARGFFTGPKIVIEYPIDGETITNSYIEIRGATKNISLLYLNNRQIFTDENGLFKEGLLLARGYNIIEVRVKDKFNREIKEIRQIVFK
jgi:hypothetical protein